MGEGTAIIASGAATEPPSTTGWWPLSSCLSQGALPAAVPCARRHARAVLAEWGLHSVWEAAELVVSELVTNAVQASAGVKDRRHGGADVPVVAVRLATDRDRLLVEVWDSIADAPVARHAGPDDESGYGLLLVEELCSRWSWRVVSGWPGKVVWAELRYQ